PRISFSRRERLIFPVLLCIREDVPTLTTILFLSLRVSRSFLCLSLSPSDFIFHTVARASATFIPSIPAALIPPDYPAPSPQGYSPLRLLSKYSSLLMRTGDDVLASIPHKIVSGRPNPLIFRSNAPIPSQIASQTSRGRQFLMLPKATSPFVFG